MDKQNALEQIRKWLTTGVVTANEVATLTERLQNEHTATSETVASQQGKQSWLPHFTIKNVFYMLGGLVLGLGIITLMAQVWDQIGAGLRILVTLGSGLFLLGLGILYTAYEARRLAAVLFVLGAILTGGGGLVFLDELLSLNLMNATILHGILTALFTGLALTQRSTPLAFFAISTAVATVYLAWLTMVESLDWQWRQVSTSLEWLTILLGLCLSVGAVYLARSFARGISALAGFFGVNMVMLTLAIKVPTSGWWEIVFFLVSLGLLVLAAYVGRTWLLLLGMVYLFGYVIYITSVYFANSLGWPVALMLLGVVLLGLGYGSLQLHQRFIKSAAEQ